MKNLAVVFVVAVWSFIALAADPAKQAGAVMVPAGDLKFTDVSDSPGVQIAAVDGDPAKGPSHFFLKFAGGFAAPLHHHTSNHYVTVVSGTLVLVVDGKEQKLPAGSFVALTGKTKHVTRCEAGADCMLGMDVRGKWDVVPETVAKK
jgi:mannose-6-phosphate isomerase-like protein (cupin superfamily)